MCEICEIGNVKTNAQIPFVGICNFVMRYPIFANCLTS
jgi:hypothetical protein